MFTSYAPRVSAHPTRTGANRGTAGIRLLIVHTSEGGELPTSAEALARFIATPRTDTNLASYHYIADTDQVIPVVPDNYVAYANAGANSDGLSICYPGKAGQTPEQWRDGNSSAMHGQVARWLADKSADYGIPLRKLTTAQVADGQAGVCGHFEVTMAYRRSTHTDPGPYYPWDEVMASAVALLAPPDLPPTITDSEDDDMVLLITCNDGVDQEVWVTNGPTKSWVPDADALAAIQYTLGEKGKVHKLTPSQFRGYGVSTVAYPGRDAWGVRLV